MIIRNRKRRYVNASIYKRRHFQRSSAAHLSSFELDSKRRANFNLRTFIVKKIQRVGEVANNLTRLSFCEMLSFLNSIQQLSSVYFFKNQIKPEKRAEWCCKIPSVDDVSRWRKLGVPIVIFEKLEHLNDVGMPLTLVISFDFFEYAIPRMSRHLFDYLDRVLQISEHVYASFDRCVCSLSQNFAFQLIKVWNMGRQRVIFRYRVARYLLLFVYVGRRFHLPWKHDVTKLLAVFFFLRLRRPSSFISIIQSALSPVTENQSSWVESKFPQIQNT